MKTFTQFLEEAKATLDTTKPTSVAAYRQRVEDELFDRWQPIINDFLAQVQDDALNAYTAGTLIAAGGKKADPFSFTNVQKRWYGAVRRLASVADMEPSEAFIQYTITGADLPHTAYEETRALLLKGKDEGWTEYQLKRALSKQLIPKQRDREKWKGDRNAYRTSVVFMARATATETASRETLKELGIRQMLYKKWVAHKDDRTRHTHRAADGQTVPVNQAFTVGGQEMQYPGDRKAPIELWANCRCIMVGTRRKKDTMNRKKKFSLTASIADLHENDNLAFWQGTLVVEGQKTGDGRMIAKDAITWDTPLPLRYVAEDTGGHNNAQDVGLIQYVERVENPDNPEENLIRAGGIFDLGSDIGREAHRQVAEGFKKGVSVDLDDVVFEIRATNAPEELEVIHEIPAPEQSASDGEQVIYDSKQESQTQVTTSARLRAATIVSIPAFKDAKIHLVDDDSSDMKPEDFETPDEAELEEAAAEADNFDPEEAEAEYAGKRNWVDEVGGLPSYIRRIAKHLIAKGMTESHAIASAVNTVKRWARGGGNVKPKTRAKALKAVAEWEAKKARAKVTAAKTITAGATITLDDGAPEAWFNNPELTQPTPLTVTNDGRVYGHVATWGTCHISFPDDCTTPPHSQTGYAYFHTGEYTTLEGVNIAVGRLTMGTGHADPRQGVVAATSHYDNTGTAVADVRAGEDEHGIWVAGALRDTITPQEVKTLKSSPLSGDWRRVGGNLEMVGALAVNFPGFPIPRPKAFRSEATTKSLVASGMVTEQAQQPATVTLTADELSALKELAATQRNQRRQQLGNLNQAIRRAELANLNQHII